MRRFGGTALHAAAFKNHVDMAKLLLLHGADVNDKDKRVYPLPPLR